MDKDDDATSNTPARSAGEVDTLSLWERTAELLRPAVEPYNYRQWISPIRALEADEAQRLLVLLAPDGAHARWIEENFLGSIQQALRELTGGPFEIRVHPPKDGGPQESPSTQPQTSPRDGDEARRRSTPEERAPAVSSARVEIPGLIGRYRFDTFVHGPNNQFALTAARAAADRPGSQYNPLFLYGGVGLGKTHLLHAVGHAVAAQNPAARIRYVTSETYVNDLIDAIRNDGMQAFRRTYRDDCDVLLVDDIQFIAGKDRTQEEFFHMFNTLHSNHKQIVMTSDQLPRSIPDMEDRLKSRLEWGLIADIKPPSFETRVAILKRKADEDEVPLNDAVAMLLARHITRNVRELEGALLRLAAHARIFGKPIDANMAREVLGDLVNEDLRRLTPEAIAKAIAHEFHVTLADLKGPSRARTVSVPRQVAMHFIRTLTDASLPQIGRYFGGRDHSTVLSALKRVDKLRQADPTFDERIERLKRQFSA